MPTYEAGTDGAWHHKGWLAVAPGDSPVDPTIPDSPVTPTDPGTPTTPTGRRVRFYTTDLVSNGVAPGTGGGTGGGTTPVPSGSTYFGAEPNPAGNSTTNQQQLINKFGGRPASRQYFGANWATPVHLAGISVAQWSWGAKDAGVIDGTLHDQIAAGIAAMKNGDLATYAHESENDGPNKSALTGQAKADRIKAANIFYDIAKATKPGVLVTPTYIGGTLASYGTDAVRDSWIGQMKGDLIGVDCDGVHAADALHPNETNYDRIDYLDEINNALRYVTKFKANGYIGVTVPEFATSRITSFDPNGTMRAAWIDKQCTMFKAKGVYAVHFFDHPKDAGDTSASINTLPNPSPELTVMRNYVASNPANPA